MSYKVEELDDVPENETTSVDRPDYTTEQSTVNVDLDVQTERIVAVTIAENTDAIPLTGFSGSWIKTGEFAYVRGAVYCGVAGSIRIEQSHDGETLHNLTTQAYTIAPATGGGFVVDIVLPYARVVFTPTAAGHADFMIWARMAMA